MFLTGIMGITRSGVDSAQAAPEIPAPSFAPPLPVVSVSVGTVRLGSTFTISATFNNTGDVGYGPFIDLYIPRTGQDGVYPGSTPGVDTYDGISPVPPATNYSATYLGSALTVHTLTFPNSGGGTGCVNHPLALNTTGFFQQVCGKAGDQLVVVVLPFGSFTPGQPPVTVEIPAYLSPLADLSPALTIRARAGFQFGATPTVDWCCTVPPDTTILSDSGVPATWTSTGSVTPTLVSFTKSGAVETATGPNFPQTYTLTVDVADGQTVTNLHVTDSLPDNIYYLGGLTSNPPASSIVTQPAVGGPYASASLDLLYNTIIGGPGNDVTVSFDYYISETDAGSGAVLPPTTGASSVTVNNAAMSGSWTPLDTRDGPQPVSGTGIGTGTNRSLDIGKSAAVAPADDTGASGPTPGDVVTYTIDFTISDFFAFENLIATDIIGDGQHFYTDGSHLPRLVLQTNGGTSNINFDGANYSVTCNYSGTQGSECDASDPSPNDGSTEVEFRLSDELVFRSLSGQLLGGLVADGGSADDGATSGQIVFYTQIQDRYADDYSGTNLKQGDSLADTVSMIGNLLDVSTCNPGPCTRYAGDPTATDGGTAGVEVGEGLLVKTIYALNGTACASQPCSDVHVAPGDTVTYRIRYDLVTGDFDGLSLTDYLPLPVFKADDPNADGSTVITYTEDTLNSIPAVGQWRLGPADTRGIDPGSVIISGQAASNYVRFNFGSYDDPANLPRTIDILFTVRVTTEPFADGLQLTNQVQQQDSNSPGSVSTTDRINQLTLTEPVLVNDKTVVATDNPAVLPVPPVPGPISFTVPGVVGPAWSGGTINSNYLGADNSALNSAISGIDGGDLVKFAIVIQNVGSGLNGAFDITLRDTLPSGYVVPGIGVQGINLQVTRGDGTVFLFTNVGGGSGLLDLGIQITDPVVPPADPEYGFGACQAHDATNGKNVILVTYDLMVDPNVAPGQLIQNKGEVTSYAGEEGGPNHLPEPDEDEAGTTIAGPSMLKNLVGTEIVSAGNGNTQAVIGELVDYSLVVTFPEGISPNTVLTDTLPAGLAFVEMDPITPFVNSNPDTDGPAGTLDDGISFTGSDVPVVTNSGRTITWTLGTVSNTNANNLVPETLTFNYTVVVLNVAGNQAGTTLNNSAILTWDTKDETGATIPASQGPVVAPVVTVIEPVLTITKQVCDDAVDPCSGIAGLDAGDTLYYRIQLTASGTDAFDLTFTDTLPTVLNSPSIASVSGANLADFEIVGGVLRTTVAADIDLAPGASIILYVLGTVDYSVIPGQAIANTGTVRWTSLNGAVSDRSTYNADSDERNGSGIPAVNDYTSFATVNVSISTTSHFKYLMNTSELHTSGLQAGRTRVSVGEIVRYRLVVQIPEGTSPNFQLQDQLPPGLTYLDDGSATIAFVSTDPVGNPIQSTGIGIIPAIPSGCNLSGNAADAATPAQTSLCILDDLNSGSDNATNADPDVYTTTGVDVYFKLGTLRNNDSDADGEFVVIEFNALVDNNNTSGANRNDASDTRDNNFLVFINGAQVGVASGNVGIYIAEPLLTVVKSIFTTPGDAGDTVEYRLTITAGAGVNRSTAFDLSLTDTLNANLVPVSASVFSTTQPATCTGNGSGTTGFLTSAGFSGQLATITATCLDPGRNIVFSIVARVANNAPAGQIIPNTGTLRYTSLPGSGTALTINTIPAVTSVTPGASGTTYGERDGSNGTGNPNDHYSTSTVNLTLLTPTFDKRPASPLNYTIGDTVTFNILVTLNEGVTRSLSVTDNLPAGLQYVTGSVEVITTAALSGGLLTNDFDGTFTNSAPGWFTCTGVCGSGDDVILNFGDTTVAADLPVDDPSDDAFLVRFQARVLDVPANIDGLVLTNRANITYINPNTGSPVTLPDDIATVTLIEARIATDKDVTPTTSVQAGDALTYTVRFTNTGNSPAYDVTAMDSLAQGVDFIALTGCVDQASASVPSLAVDNGATVDFGGNPAGSRDIPVSGWIECTYSAVALNGLYMNGSHVNTVDADWTSLNGSVSGERDYNDTGSSPFDALQDQDTATFTADAPTFVKDDSGITQVVIGDTITFHLTVGGEAGTYRDVLITDVLPAGLIYNVGSSQVTLNGSSAVRAPDSVSAPNDGSAAVTLTWDFNDLYKDGTDMVITYTAQVANVIGNQINGTLINNAAFDHDHADGTPATQLTSSASSTITEPVIVTTKNALPTSGVEAGDVINYTTRFTNTGTSTAYETTAQDALPANVDYNSDAACVFFDGVTTNLIAVTVTGSTSLNFGTWDIPATAPDSYVECTYSITTRSDIALGASHTNLVDADWTSLNGTDANERNYNDSVSRTGVDETPGADDDVAAFTTDAPASLTKGIDVTQTAIGDVFHITITIVSPLGAITDTSLDDVLPAGMIYVTGTQTVTSNITTPAFSVTGPNDGTAATTLIWDFGDAVVTGNPVVVEYDARAANVAGNVDGTGLTNNVTFHYTDGAGPHTFTDDATVSVIEPLLTVTKAHSVLAIAPDAGDTVHYIVDIAPDLTAPNVSTATAYDVVFSDLLPSTYVSLDVSSISVTATGWTPTSVDTSASSVTTVDVRVSDIPNTPGTGLRIEYDVTLKNTVTPSQLIANTGDLTWTSTPGSNGNERTGSGSGANDYSDSSTDSFTVHDPAFSKSIASTDNPHTIDPSVAIGETITFDLVITLPEGTTPSIHIYDDLPAGLQYIVETPTVIPAPGFIGSIPTPTVAPATPPAGNGQDVTVDFTAITVDPDGDPANDHLTVRFRAVVLNDLANQDGGSLLNTATMTVAGTDYSDDATASIVEPVLTIAKSVTDPYPGPGQTLDFTIVVEHDALLPSTASAHNVVIFDDLPDAQLTLVPGSISVATLGGVSGVVFNPVVEPVQVQVDRIDVGGRVTVTFQAMVSSGITVGEAVANTATARWTSMPGPVADERLGTGGALNDYAAVNTVNLSADKSITKTLIADNHLDTVLPEVAIGELLTYRVEFNVPTGSTDAVTLTDQLEPGLAYVDCLSIAADAGIATSLPGGFDAVCQNAAVTAIGAPANPASPGRQVVFDFGTLTNISGGIGTVTVEYRAAVLDVIENQDAQTLNNRATLTWSYGSLNSQPPVPVSVVEPELLLEKTASVGTALPGADIVFTLTVRHDTANSTADAYDVLLRDDLPSGLTLIGIPVPMSGIAPTSITVTGTLIEVFWADFPRLPDGESVIQFTARLGSLLPGTSVSNEATVEWTSLPGTPPNPYAPPQPVLPSGVQSVYNARSTERRYDPLSPVDIYQTTATSAVGVPRLPDTGFAPGILTGLPEQPQDMSYAQLDGMWLEIPALGVRMPIIGVPMSEAGWDLTWLGDQAGYLEGTAYPSWDGNTGITGHVYLPNGSPGPFVDLGRLYWGQQVIVHLDGFEYVYEVRSVRRVMPGDLSVLGHSDTPVLTLITCQGYDPYGNAYRYRVAVRAVLVAIH